MPSPPTILVVLPNWLGDVVMATPLLDLLREGRDASGRPPRLEAVVRRRWAPLLAGDPRLDGLHRYERTGRHAGWRGLPRLASAWRGTGADAAVLCPPSLRTACAAWLARIPRRIGHDADGRRPWLTTAVARPAPRGVLHHTDELLALGQVAAGRLDLAVPNEAAGQPRLPALDGLAPRDVGEGPPVWVLAPGATYGTAKAWPAARVAEFLTLAVAERGVRVAIVGDAASRVLATEVRGAAPGLPWRRDLPGRAAVIDLVGETSLPDLAALLRASAAFLGNDSGVMHLAAALGVPTLGLFGSSSVAWTGPRGPRAEALAARGFPCQPCFRRTCNQPVFCLATLAAADVLARLDALVAGTAPEARA